MSEDLVFISKDEALKIIMERTGRKFSRSIFSKRFSRTKVFSISRRLVLEKDVYEWLSRREARAKEPASLKLDRVIAQRLAQACRLQTQIERLILHAGLSPASKKELSSAASYAAWTVLSLHEARRQMGVSTASEEGN